MSEEKKEKEKLKEKKQKSILINLSNIQTNLSEAMKAQETITMQVAKLAIATKPLASFTSPLASLAQSLRAMNIFNTAIHQHAFIRALQAPLVSQAMFQYQAQVKALAEGLTRVSKMVEMPKINISTITTELTAIPPQNNRTVKSLLRHIDRLEKELSKEKAKNKELLQLLENMKKKVKQQYIA